MQTATPRPRDRHRFRDEPTLVHGGAHRVTQLGVLTGPMRAWVRAVRIRQWAKNLLVFGAPAAAAALSRPGVLARVTVTFVVFCLLASGAYLINDVRDATEDRQHPRKRHRPVASGEVPARRALAVGVTAILLGLAMSLAVSWDLLAVACGYALLNAGYTGWLRSIAIADISAIAGAFVLRAVAGGVAADVPISRWFLVVVSFASLFVAAGKRYADFLDPVAQRSRPVLDEYNADFLRLALAVACAVSLGSYCLWALQTVGSGVHPWRELTIIPFTIAVLRYGLLVTGGGGGAPEQILFSDRFLQLVGAAWLVMFGLGV